MRINFYPYGGIWTILRRLSAWIGRLFLSSIHSHKKPPSPRRWWISKLEKKCSLEAVKEGREESWSAIL